MLLIKMVLLYMLEQLYKLTQIIVLYIIILAIYFKIRIHILELF